MKFDDLSYRLPVHADLDEAVACYWANRHIVYPVQVWIVPTTSDHLHFSQPVGHNTYL